MSGRLFNIVFMAGVVCVAVVSLYFFGQQKIFLQSVQTASRTQGQTIEQLKADMRELKDQVKTGQQVLDLQKVKLDEVEQESAQVKVLLPQIKESIAEIKSVIAQSRAEAWKIKDDSAQWQKDYVSTLVDIQKRVNALDQALNSISDIVDQGFPKILQEIDSIKENLNSINKKAADKASGHELLQPLPRFDPRLP